ncbi:hypothetical protein CR513_19448, partial [Mucuna pruriens]
MMTPRWLCLKAQNKKRRGTSNWEEFETLELRTERKESIQSMRSVKTRDDSCQTRRSIGCDRWRLHWGLFKRIEPIIRCVKYSVKGDEFWRPSEQIDLLLPKSMNSHTFRVIELGNMGAESKRETIPIKVKTLGVAVLRGYAEMFKGSNRCTFEGRYGKILDLVEIEVQLEAISALAQFYDLPMRSFLFLDFQIAQL